MSGRVIGMVWRAVAVPHCPGNWQLRNIFIVNYRGNPCWNASYYQWTGFYVNMWFSINFIILWEFSEKMIRSCKLAHSRYIQFRDDEKKRGKCPRRQKEKEKWKTKWVTMRKNANNWMSQIPGWLKMLMLPTELYHHINQSNSLRSKMNKMDEEINSLNREFEIMKERLNEIWDILEYV